MLAAVEEHVPSPGTFPCGVIVGLMGSGRTALTDFFLQYTDLSFGEGLEDFRAGTIRSGHVCQRSVRGFSDPVVMDHLIRLGEEGRARLVFLLRNPLDSVITNWFWWRELDQTGRTIAGVADVEDPREIFHREQEDFLQFCATGNGFMSLTEYLEETLALFAHPLFHVIRFEDMIRDRFRTAKNLLTHLSCPFDPQRLVGIQPPRSKVDRHKDFLAPKFIRDLTDLQQEILRKLGYETSLDV